MKQLGLLAALIYLLAPTLHADVFGVAADLKLEQTEFLPGEDVPLKVRVLNRSGQELKLGADEHWLQISIVNENNNPCHRMGEVPVQGEFSLLSGEAGIKTVNPTPYFDFRQMGRYRVTATVRIPQWQQEITCKPVSFTVANGVTLPNMANLQFGVPLAPGATNTTPEVRAYSLLKVSFFNIMKLYFRLTDAHGKILRCYAIDRMMSFSQPEGQIDRFNNFHVLHQTGARSFNYCEINPDGEILKRQTYAYTDTRPVLRMSDDGQIFVAGGGRQVSATDFPPIAPDSAIRN
jgi:hypothetical protein